MNSYRVIDQSTWERNMHCSIFRESVEPNFCITLELDITKFLTRIKENKYSFTFAMIYEITKCANTIEALRYRFLDDEVVLFDKIDTAFTYLNKDTELFKVVNVPMTDTMEEYVKLALETANNQTEYFTGPLGTDVFQFSPLPWVSYTHISHTISGKRDMSTPLFDWGKYFIRDEKVIMPFTVQANHSFVDGIHIGRFVQALQKVLNE